MCHQQFGSGVLETPHPHQRVQSRMMVEGLLSRARRESRVLSRPAPDKNAGPLCNKIPMCLTMHCIVNSKILMARTGCGMIVVVKVVCGVVCDDAVHNNTASHQIAYTGCTAQDQPRILLTAQPLLNASALSLPLEAAPLVFEILRAVTFL